MLRSAPHLQGPPRPKATAGWIRRAPTIEIREDADQDNPAALRAALQKGRAAGDPACRNDIEGTMGDRPAMEQNVVVDRLMDSEPEVFVLEPPNRARIHVLPDGRVIVGQFSLLDGKRPSSALSWGCHTASKVARK
ncbi:hypothetical protein U5903_22095 [Cereibacter johrii]|uniref:hypothetical protein n=1 Tax=Cereibacter johrii TaxID=445629 RepID=UPI002B25E7E8|nr:hypothetical protein [Cereibacter johrii]MEA5163472.1 hypothetical protein [Cereibacter johrii]